MDGPAATNNPVVSTPGGGPNLTRWGLIVLGIFFLIVVGELTYLAFSQKSPAPIFKKEAVVSPSPSPVAETEERTIVQEQEPQYKGSINADKIVDFLRIADILAPKKEFVSASTITLTVRGVVEEAFQGEVISEGRPYVYRLRLANSGKNLTYLLSQGEMAGLTVILGGGDRKEGTISDVAVGDDVIIYQTTNLLDSSPDAKIILEVTKKAQ